MTTRTQIKKFLNQTRWSVKCKRLIKFLNDYNLTLQQVKIKKTSNRNWMLNGTRNRNIVAFDLIGFNSNAYIFVYVEKQTLKQGEN